MKVRYWTESGMAGYSGRLELDGQPVRDLTRFAVTAVPDALTVCSAEVFATDQLDVQLEKAHVNVTIVVLPGFELEAIKTDKGTRYRALRQASLPF